MSARILTRTMRTTVHGTGALNMFCTPGTPRALPLGPAYSWMSTSAASAASASESVRTGAAARASTTLDSARGSAGRGRLVAAAAAMVARWLRCVAASAISVSQWRGNRGNHANPSELSRLACRAAAECSRVRPDAARSSGIGERCSGSQRRRAPGMPRQRSDCVDNGLAPHLNPCRRPPPPPPASSRRRR